MSVPSIAMAVDRTRLLPRSGIGVEAPWLIIAPPGNPVIRLDARLLDRVELIALAVLASLLPVRSIDLDHRHPRRHETAGDTRPVRAGSFDPNAFDHTERRHPRRQRSMPASRRRERLHPEQSAVHVDHRGNVEVAMRVDPTNHQTR